jgi:hypothetical protein
VRLIARAISLARDRWTRLHCSGSFKFVVITIFQKKKAGEIAKK